jgi:glycosyltransferase involved in cell wall biosynthesis
VPPAPTPARRIACFATQGAGHRDDQRIRALLEELAPRPWPFDHDRKAASMLRVLRRGLAEHPDAVVVEGTGVAGGVAVMLLDLAGVRYLVSTGDAVAPFLSLRRPWLGPVARIYERALLRRAAGVIAWSPYLAGRALTLGARRAMTAAGWAPPASPSGRDVRRELGIPHEALVFGLAGSLDWTQRAGYCYGLELVRAVARSDRDDLYVVIAGDGSGRRRLASAAGALLDRRVFLPGQIARDEVPAWLAAFDVASLPQSVDSVGAFRYTTKLSEYLAAGLPVVTGQLPLAYDLDEGWLWRLPGDAPWKDDYVAALAELMSTLGRGDLERRRALVPRALRDFDRDRQKRAVAAFVLDALA